VIITLASLPGLLVGLACSSANHSSTTITITTHNTRPPRRHHYTSRHGSPHTARQQQQQLNANPRVLPVIINPHRRHDVIDNHTSQHSSHLFQHSQHAKLINSQDSRLTDYRSLLHMRHHNWTFRRRPTTTATNQLHSSQHQSSPAS